MIGALIVALSALFWRIRGILGWPGTLAFGLVQAFTLYPIFGSYSLLATLLILILEPYGWKPKNWNLPAWTRWEPQIKFLQNPRPFKVPGYDNPKFLLDWRGAWVEVWAGMVVSILINICAIIYEILH